jgi:predicted flap endonuclease-1-like 5' DNA nuclease
LEPLDYTEQNVITLKDCKERIANEIIRVKRLSHKSKAWIMDPQEDGKLYLDDLVSRIAGVGKGIEKSLKDNNIMTVADLRGLNQQMMKSIAKTTRGLGLSLLE